MTVARCSFLPWVFQVELSPTKSLTDNRCDARPAVTFLASDFFGRIKIKLERKRKPAAWPEQHFGGMAWESYALMQDLRSDNVVLQSRRRCGSRQSRRSLMIDFRPWSMSIMSRYGSDQFRTIRAGTAACPILIWTARAGTFSRPSAQPVTAQCCVCVSAGDINKDSRHKA